METIAISIIAPVYKIEENTLKHALKCMYEQDFPKDLYEIILIDDGSPDNCGKICDEFARKNKSIKVIHTENMGVSHARNTGIKYSRGKYLCFVDPDDYICSTMLSCLYKIAVDYKAELIICNFQYGNSFQKSTEEIYEFEKEKLKEVASSFIGGDAPFNTNITGAPWGKLYLKRVLEENRCFFDEQLPRSQDNEFNFRYAQLIEKCIYINKVLYQYNIIATSAMRKYWPKAIENANILLEKIQMDINTTEEKEYYKEAFYGFVFGKVEDLLYTNIAHPDNKQHLPKKIYMLKKIFDRKIYRENIERYEYKGKNKYRKMLLFCMKRHFYPCVYILAKIRVIIKNRR